MAESAGIQKLGHRHEAILDYMIANPAVPKWKVAEEFGISQAWLSTIINSDAFVVAMEEKHSVVFHETVLPLRKKLMALADETVDRLGELVPISKDIEAVRRTADSVLKAVGYGSPEPGGGPSHQVNVQNNYYGNAAREVLERARESIGRGAPKVLEGTVEEKPSVE